MNWSCIAVTIFESSYADKVSDSLKIIQVWENDKNVFLGIFRCLFNFLSATGGNALQHE